MRLWSNQSRYRVTDPYRRFWLTFLGPHVPEIERGRGDRVLHRIDRSWGSTSVFAVSRSGSSVPGLRTYEPDEPLAAW